MKDCRLQSYFNRGDLFKTLCEHNLTFSKEMNFLELGTGWFHWYAIYIRLFHEVNTTLFDVWDNRQFDALHKYSQKLKSHFESLPGDYSGAIKNLQKVINADSFEEIYQTFNMNYVIESEGSLAQFPAENYDCIFSFHVMEHVKSYEATVAEIYRLLKPGGFSIHQIGIDDHHTHYDKQESPKNYFRYSELSWKLLFENDLQYINRVQMSDWFRIFEERGFVFVDKRVEFQDIGPIKVQPRYQHYSKEDQECTILTIVHQKPK
ncbi:MAG: class I SAM-dependent methyltransferase [Deferribacteres bacterium]|nr:class I SAM-dependent methyltransferase [candidate division KSB1 bacterium]MCB9504259.1 class I SAM-dependent methyltransferase [Deferribacteres bacterium]